MINKRKKWEEAIRWFLWMREHKANAEETDIFKHWQKQDPEQQAAFEEIKLVWELCDSVDDLPWPLPSELADDIYDGSQPIALPDLPASTVLSTTSHQLFGSHKEQATARSSQRRLGRRIYAVAASFFIFVAVGLLGFKIYQPNAIDIYETAVATQKMFQLEDGSIITMGASSRLSVQYSERQRNIKLLSGEAYFEVKKDSQRPFVVDTGSTSVEAIGTAFNINKRAESVVVSVMEGVVKFERVLSDSKRVTNSTKPMGEMLLEGQQVIYQKQSGQISLVNKAELTRANSWRNGSLAYVSEHLDKVIEDVNRYSKIKVVIGDKEIADLVFTGTVLNHDVNNWLNGLVKTFPVRLLKLEDKIVLLTSLKS